MDNSKPDDELMLNVAINRHGHLAVLQVDGSLDTVEAVETLSDSLLFMTADDELVLDLSCLTTITDVQAAVLHERLLGRRTPLPTTIIASTDEVQLALCANGFDQFARIVPTVALACDVVVGRAALNDIIVNWQCARP